MKMLKDEPSGEIVWTADLHYWLAGQKQAGKGHSDWFTEEGHLRFCRELGCMPYYWYENFWLAEPEYEKVEVVTTHDGRRRRQILKTPVGRLCEESIFMTESVSEACTKHAVETEADLKVLLYILEHRRLKPAAIDLYRERMNLWAEYDGLPAIGMPRSPLSSFLNEWTGMNNGVYLMLDHPEMVRHILDLMENQERPVIEALCRLAPPLIHFPDNLSSENLTGFFDEFMAEPYRRRLDAFHTAGIRCAVHLETEQSGGSCLN